MGCLNGATIGIFLTLAAAIIGGIGVFSDAWWLDGRNNTYSLFTVVNCTEGVCALSPTGVECKYIQFKGQNCGAFTRASDICDYRLKCNPVLISGLAHPYHLDESNLRPPPPPNFREVVGAYWFGPVCPFICPSVTLFGR